MHIQNSKKPELWLQDDDCVTVSSWSTSILTPIGATGIRKARVVAEFAERMGFETRIVEQRLLSGAQATARTPRLVLFGVDNLDARRLISRLPFVTLIEAGLGDAFDTFRGIRIHAFPQLRDSQAIWRQRATEDRSMAPAYRALLEKSKDGCGIMTLASRAVGVPFVGCFAACLVLAELFRRTHNGVSMSLQEINMRELPDRESIVHV